jgi:hypothetical protein
MCKDNEHNFVPLERNVPVGRPNAEGKRYLESGYSVEAIKELAQCWDSDIIVAICSRCGCKKYAFS